MPVGRKLVKFVKKVGRGIKSYPGSLSPERRRARKAKKLQAADIQQVRGGLQRLDQRRQELQSLGVRRGNSAKNAYVARNTGVQALVLQIRQKTLNRQNAQATLTDAQTKLRRLNAIPTTKRKPGHANLVTGQKARERRAAHTIRNLQGEIKLLQTQRQATESLLRREFGQLRAELMSLQVTRNRLHTELARVSTTPAATLHPPKPVGRFERFMSTPLNETVLRWERERTARRRAGAGG